MKKALLLVVAIFTMSTMTIAQTNLGVRLGAGYGYGLELSGQFGMGSNRLEADLGFSSYHNDWTYINLCGIWQWTWEISGPWGWYAGVGANLGVYSGEYDGFGLGVAAQIGLEFNPNIPLQFTLDVRPNWGFVGYSGFGWGAALGIRYKF